MNREYSGAALTLTDALSTLAVIGDAHNFERGVNWLIANVRPSPLGYLVRLACVRGFHAKAILPHHQTTDIGVDPQLQMSYNIDVRVNVFEANIRMLGGLLSAHLLAQDPVRGPLLMPGGYDGGLLVLAEELGRRLLPAFTASPTGEQLQLLT